jgi:hypothetical protein
MSLWDHLLGKKSKEEPSLLFGRYSDAYKDSEKYDAWDLSLEKFTQGLFLESYRLFLDYLYDEDQKNVSYRENNGVLHFEILQGSRKITGQADDLKVSAKAQLATTRKLEPHLLQRLLERNFDLTFSRYALDEKGDIHIVFDTYTVDGSPYKLYYALKELATNADKLDDLLLAEYESFLPVDTGITREVPTEEKEIKYNYFQRSILKTLQQIQDHAQLIEDYPTVVAYLILSLSYKLDYLIKPEGTIMEAFERIHRLQFAQDGVPVNQKNELLIHELEQLAAMDRDHFFREMYQVSSTFGITKPVNHKQIAGFIEGELHRFAWYLENGYPDVAQAITSYLVGYCLFNYALPLPDRQFFHLYYQVTEEPFFNDLGINRRFFHKDGKRLSGRAVRRAIREIRDQCEGKYEGCEPGLDGLHFESLPEFCRSYMEMIRDLEFQERVT